jgi:hypothetical protein
VPKRLSLKLDHKGIAALLKSQAFAEAMHRQAEAVAQSVREQLPGDADVVVDDYTTDRRASSVTIRDPRGRLWEVRDGVLSRAAVANGLEVTERR